MKDFEVVEHTGDIKIQVFGLTKCDLFLHALQGMFHILRPESVYCRYVQERLVCTSFPASHPIEIQSVDVDSLLVDFLSHSLFLSDVHNEIYVQIKYILFSDTHLNAYLYGVPIIGFARVELKAVTYHDLHIHYDDGFWQTDIVFDI